MSKYRFKTKEEFIQDRLWYGNHPYTWNSGGNMNKYLGQDIPKELNDTCDKGVGFNYEGWSFCSDNYVLKETPVDMKAIQEEAKKRFPIGCSFKNTNGNIYTLKKDDYVYEIYGKSIWAHNGCGCLYKDGEWAELISLPESVSINEFKEGDYIVTLDVATTTACAKNNYCFKQRVDNKGIYPVVDLGGSKTNGHDIMSFDKKKYLKEWRYATPEEIAEYDRINEPYDVTTLQKKEIFPKNGYVVITSNPINLINYLKNSGRISASDNSYNKEKTIIAWNNGSYWYCTLGSYKPEYSKDYIENIIGQSIYSNNTLDSKKELFIEEIPEYVKCVKTYGDAKIGTIYKTSDKKEASDLFGLTWEQVLIQYLHLGNQFISSTKEAYEAQLLSKENVIKKSKSPLEICKQKYKKGMVVLSAEESGMYSGTFTINVDPEEFTITGGDGVDYFRSEGFLYYMGKYAEILSYPDEQLKIEYPNSEDSVLNEITIQKETFIENVQSINVMLRTKKKSIKF